MAMMKRKFVKELGWLTEDEMLDIVSLAHASPGAIAINSSMLLGYKIKGFKGALLTVAGTVLPPLIVMSVVVYAYDFFIGNALVEDILEGARAGVTAVMVSAVMGITKAVLSKNKVYSIISLAIAMVLLLVFDINPMFIIIAAAIVGYLRYLFLSRREKNKC